MDLFCNDIIETDSTIEIKGLIIQNDGNIEADVTTIMYAVPQKDLISFNLNHTLRIGEIDSSRYRTYQYTSASFNNSLRCVEGQQTLLNGNIKYRKTNKIKRIPYTIYYSSKYKSGSEVRCIYLVNKPLEELIKMENVNNNLFD